MSDHRTAHRFLELLSPLRDSLYRFACRSAWREDLASDIVQEAVMIAWKQYDRFEEGTNFRAWIYKILVNTVYTFNSRVARSPETGSTRLDETIDTLLEREEAWLSVLEDPQRVFEALDDRLVRSLERLSPDERECLLLRLLENLSYKEIAGMLDIPVGTVMSHVHRARMKLREQLADLALEEGIVREGNP